jgi:hypothetical protein
MVHRSLVDPMEQMRDFDFVQGAKDVMVGLGALAQDVFSQLGATVVAGISASQTASASLTVNLTAGRIYQLAPADALSAGSLSTDLTIIVQQGLASAQTVTLTAPSAGQSQWNLIQAQFSQVDAVRSGDPNGGVVPFYNAANPTQPTSQSINTVRQGLCIIQSIAGAPATTGAEVPPLPSTGWVPLYLIDLTGGQTQITTSQILQAGPGVGTGVPLSYPPAPFVTGLLAPHHGGVPGQAPKINLPTETQGVLPYANMSPVRTLLNAPLTLYVNGSTGNDSNLGLSPSSPFLTIQAAINAGYGRYDFNSFGWTINIANGTYGANVSAGGAAIACLGMPVGMTPASGPINIVGNVSGQGNVQIGVVNGNGLLAQGACSLNLSGVTISATGTNSGNIVEGYGLYVSTGSQITVTNVTMGNCGQVQLGALNGGIISVSSGCVFTGATGVSMSALNAGQIFMSLQTITNSVGVTVAYVQATTGGIISAVSVTFVGTGVSGPRFLVSLNGTTSGAGANLSYFPGTSAGFTTSGGQYA